MVKCRRCGGYSLPGFKHCIWCNAPLTGPLPPKPIKPPDTQENRVILAKIKTRKDELERTSQLGPVLLFIIGLFGLIWLFGGLLIIGAVIWSRFISKTKLRLSNEIKELEAQFIW
jgi:hypothetical protein